MQVIDGEGNNLGEMLVNDALRTAQDAGLDLVEMTADAKPPVCKILNYGKLKYNRQKRKSEAKKKQKIVEVKEIKFRPNTDTHDYEVKLRSIRKFLENGDRVKVTLRFRGREMAHETLGVEMLKRVEEDSADISKVEQQAKSEGRQMIMMLCPL